MQIAGLVNGVFLQVPFRMVAQAAIWTPEHGGGFHIPL
jgi:hypothetical protein